MKLLHKLDNDYAWWSADHYIAGLHATGRRRVFIQSMSDIFDLEVPVEWFAEAWTTMERCDRVSLQVVAKRVSAVQKRLAAISRTTWPQHAGLIISVVNQEEADRDIPRLIELKQKLGIPWIGLSLEPLLRRIVLRPEWLEHLDWVIVGGESGPGARPMHPDWARSLRDQCAAAGVPFFFKQWGEWMPAEAVANDHNGVDFVPMLPMDKITRWRRWDGEQCRPARKDESVNEFFEPGTLAVPVGKKRAGRTLDGVTHDAMPQVQS